MSVLDFDSYNLIFTLGISFIIQIAFFAFAASFKTDKFTDLSYGSTFAIIAIVLFAVRDTQSTSQLILTMMIVLWGIRLAGYLFIRILKIKRDKRFDGIRENFWKFAQFWLLQGISIWLILLPTTVFLSETQNLELGTLNYLGLIIWLVGLTIETIADWQKFVFKSDPTNNGKWIQSGIWKYSRHPNYFGELLCWWGIFIFVLPSLHGFIFLSIVGPLTITTLLLFITGIPTLENKYAERYKNNEEYQKYKASTSLLVPLP